jgi:hypothetical protein
MDHVFQSHWKSALVSITRRKELELLTIEMESLAFIDARVLVGKVFEIAVRVFDRSNFILIIQKVSTRY